MEYWALATGGASLVGLIMAFVYAKMVVKEPPGDEKMQSIAGAIREGAMAFIRREYQVLVAFVVIVFALIAVFIWYKPAGGGESTYTGIYTAIAYIFGAACSMTAGFIGMNIATKASVRTTHGAEKGTGEALTIAFRGGAVMGLTVAGLGLLGLSLVYLIFVKWWQVISDPAGQASIIAGFSLGASSVALFARVGGGIYTKAADVGADLVGKVETGIPEDDPRNPAVIADNVGDNVGDVAGMGADLYESYVGSIVAPIALAATVFAVSGADGVTKGMLLPMIIAGVGIIASILASFFVRSKEGSHPSRALNSGSYGAALLTTLGSLFVVLFWLRGVNAVKHPIGFWISIVAGLAAGLAIGLISEFYTSDRFKPVKEIAKSSQTGPATTILSGFSEGMESTASAIILLVGAIAGAYLAGNWAMPDVANSGIYGIALAAIGMLSTTGMTVSVDAYGPIADNAGGISEMSGRPPEVRKITDSLDALGNTTAAIAKGFAIASAGVTALALFKAYTTAVGITVIDLGRWQTVVGLFLGGMFPFLFSSMAIKAVGRAAYNMIEEVRRQFREIPGLKEGKEGARAEYARCVDISTRAALKRMIPPATIAVVSPVVIGLWDNQALAGYLAGALVVGFLVAIFMANAGGAWDNAKKYIEAGNLGGKGTSTHAAAVVGDTVGDPFKDTAGPCMNIMIKVMSVIALVFAPIFIR